MHSLRVKIYALLALGFAVRVFVALQSPLALQSWPLNDDSHYYFTIARHLAHGDGLKHDSFHVTTGFQPLFLCLITPLFALIQDKLLAINAVLLMQAAIGCCAGALLYRVASLITTRQFALLALGIWATSPVILNADLNGLETCTSSCLLLATSYIYALDFVIPAGAPGRWAFVRLGFLCGLSFLARVDLGLLIPVLSADIGLRLFRRLSRRELISRLALFNATASVVISPWLVFNWVTIGSVLPSGGQAVRFLAQAYGYRYLRGSGPAFEIGHPPFAYYLLTTRVAAREALAMLHGTVPLWIGALCLGYAAFVAPREWWRAQQRLRFFFVFLGLLFCAYAWYIFGQWFLRRYFMPIAAGYVLLLVSAAEQVATHVRRRAPILRHGLLVIALSTLTVSLARSFADVRQAIHSPPSGYYDAALWVNGHTPQGSLIGAFQTGIVGYYLDRPFYGLDGKINVDALRAMKAQQIDLYVEREKIDYLMDWPWILDDLFKRRARDPSFLERRPRVAHGFYDVYDLSAPPTQSIASH
ncbi:MAG TPA: glycosyltransferase family 39 protein [Polyangiaceae bacterium]